jgi:hypothetical protein
MNLGYTNINLSLSIAPAVITANVVHRPCTWLYSYLHVKQTKLAISFILQSVATVEIEPGTLWIAGRLASASNLRSRKTGRNSMKTRATRSPKMLASIPQTTWRHTRNLKSCNIHKAIKAIVSGSPLCWSCVLVFIERQLDSILTVNIGLKIYTKTNHSVWV